MQEIEEASKAKKITIKEDSGIKNTNSSKGNFSKDNNLFAEKINYTKYFIEPLLRKEANKNKEIFAKEMDSVRFSFNKK